MVTVTRYRFETRAGGGYRAFDLASQSWLVHGDIIVVQPGEEVRVSIGPHDSLVPLDPPDSSAAGVVSEPEPAVEAPASPLPAEPAMQAEPAPSEAPPETPAESPADVEAPKRTRRRRR